VITFRRMRWAGYVAQMERWEMHTIFWLEILKGRDRSEDLGIDGRIIFEWILGKYGGKLWTGFMWLWIGTSAGLV
jgi:hypothetical protein